MKKFLLSTCGTSLRTNRAGHAKKCRAEFLEGTLKPTSLRQNFDGAARRELNITSLQQRTEKC